MCNRIQKKDGSVQISTHFLSNIINEQSGKSEAKYKFVKYLWNDEEADKLEGVDRLVYRSNRLGEDLTLTNTGGGNTSSKLPETDPLTGERSKCCG